MKTFRSYLDRLTFDSKLKTGFVHWYLTNIRVVLLIVVTILGFGLVSVMQLERRLNPELKIPIVVVTTTLPGASPLEVEQLLTIPLEKAVAQAENLDILASTSQESVSVIQMQFLTQMSVADARSEVQRLVDSVTNLPEDAQEPQVQEIDFEAVPIWEFVVSSDSPASLRALQRELVDRLESLTSIEEVSVAGLEEEVIRVQLNSDAISQGVRVTELRDQLRQSVGTQPIGAVPNQTLSFPLVLGQYASDVASLRQLPVQVGQEEVPLEHIARVEYATSDEQSRSYRLHADEDMTPAIVVSLFKSPQADIVSAQQDAAAVVDALSAEIPEGVRIETLDNTAQAIDDQFSSLLTNFGQTIILVFITLLVFLGLRQAFMASVAIPLAFLMSFIVMGATGQSLNFLSLFSLLLALGLLLDNAIVIIASITEYAGAKKFSSEQAGLLVWRDFFTPIVTTTLTTVWAFLPLILGSGIIGEFIKPIPIVVSTTLLASALVALGITLPIMMQLLSLSIPRRVMILGRIVLVGVLLAMIWFLVQSQPLGWTITLYSLVLLVVLFWLRPALAKSVRVPQALSEQSSRVQQTIARISDSGVISLGRIVTPYQRLLRKILPDRKRRWQVVIGVSLFAVFSYLLVPLGFVPAEFFPKDDIDQLYVNIELPVGTRLEETERVALTIGQELAQLPEVDFGALQNGSGSMMSGGGTGSNRATITYHLFPPEERSRTTPELVALLTDQYRFDERAQVTFIAPSGGPPAGDDITVKIAGDELQELSAIAEQVEVYLAGVEGVTGIERSITAGPSRLRFDPDISSLQDQGLSPSEVAFWVRTALGDLEVKSGAIFNPDEDQRMIITLNPDKPTIDTIGRTEIPTRSGGVVTLGQLGTFSLEPSPTQITREDGVRTLSITAAVQVGYSAPTINSELFAFLDTIELPAGYSFDTGGANEENQRSVQSILQAMLLSFVLILATMVIQLGSFRKATVVMLVIPLAIIGVFVLFALTQTPLSFPALIGVLALFGIVVNNSIILIDKINQNVAIGMELLDAIIDASGSRLSPIFLSSLTTIIGLLPITLSDPIWQGLGGAIIAGLTFSGTMMLLVIPTIYYMLFMGEKQQSATS